MGSALLIESNPHRGDSFSSDTKFASIKAAEVHFNVTLDYQGKSHVMKECCNSGGS